MTRTNPDWESDEHYKMTVCLNIATVVVVVFFSTGMFTLAMRLWKLAQWAQQSLLEFLGFHQRQ